MTYRLEDEFLVCREADTVATRGEDLTRTSKRRREEDRRRFVMAIGSEGGGSPIDVRIQFGREGLSAVEPSGPAVAAAEIRPAEARPDR
jgi:hypothetical protein